MANWGIIGCGGIARHMASALRDVPGATLAACATRTTQRAAAFADEFAIPRAYGSYEELLADPSIDIVYIAVVNTAHAAAVRLCIEAGKPVICEKPLAMSQQEGRELFALARQKGVLLMEAIWTRFLPAWQEILRRIDGGAIGDLRFAQLDFSFSAAPDPHSRLYDPAQGGGALLDVGVYTAHVAQMLFGSEIESVRTHGRLAETGVDSFAVVTLGYSGGRVAEMTCAIDTVGAQDARLFGSAGWIEVPHMFCADHFVIHRPGQKDEVCDFSGRDGFCYEAEAFQQLVAAGALESDVASPQTTLQVASVLDEAMRQLGARG